MSSSLAFESYGDGLKSMEIYQANLRIRGVLEGKPKLQRRKKRKSMISVMRRKMPEFRG